MTQAVTLLQKYWKHESFREVQAAVVQNVLAQKDTIALLPTGGGKSICFQVPALMQKGVCIVISPLIALMEDQVINLQKKGIKAIALTSNYNLNQTIQAFDNLQFGGFKFLYISPEKLSSELIQEKIKQLPVCLIAIDEAHCISQWGHDFRPAYLKINILRELLPKVNIIALTASATPTVILDIQKYLGLESATVFKKSFLRNNLYINLTKSEDLFGTLLRMLSTKIEPTIIYAGTRKKTIEISNILNQNGIKSNFYHGGLPHSTRSKKLASWVSEAYPVMVATNAFGMGIDKSNVRKVIHTHIPNSIENYMQEIGRAGRDNHPASAILIYNENTIFNSKNYLEKSLADIEFCKKVYAKLNQFYQISPGELPSKIFQFDLAEFCNTYQLSILKTFNVLQVFELHEFLIIKRLYNTKSHLKILVSKSYILEYETRNPALGNLLKVIFRNYGGTFDQFVSIDENLIAKKMQKSKMEITNDLLKLSTDNIIQYQTSNNSNQLQFLKPREDNFVLHEISNYVKTQNRSKLNKLNTMVDYVLEHKICRNVFLLDYFGEKNIKDCGICDVCISKNRKQQKVDYNEIVKKISQLFQQKNPITFDFIEKSINYERELIVKTLQLMVEKGLLKLNSQQNFEWLK